MYSDSKAHSRPAAAGRLQASMLHAYGSLSFPLAAAFIALQVLVPTYYAESTGLSLSTIGLVLLAARLWDMFTDPVVGLLSDRTRLTIGKRKSWVMLSAPAIAISAYMLFIPPAGATWIYLLVWTFAIYVAGTMAIVPMNAWGAELSPDYNERSRITGFRAFYGLLGTLVALALAAISSSAGSQDLAATLRLISGLVIITLIPACALAWVKVPDQSHVRMPTAPIRSLYRLIFKQASPLRQLLGAFLMNSIGNAIPATLFLLYVTYVIAAPQHAGPLLFLYFICAAMAVPFWIRLTHRRDKHLVWQAAVLLACGFFVWTPFLGTDDLLWFYLIVAATGFATGADLVLPVAIKGDLIEWDEHHNGLRRPGLFFAAWGTTTKLAFALAIGIAFPVLELAGFAPGQGADVEAVNNSSGNGVLVLAIMYGVPSLAFKLAAVAAMRNYPVTRRVHEQIRQEIDRTPKSGPV